MHPTSRPPNLAEAAEFLREHGPRLKRAAALGARLGVQIAAAGGLVPYLKRTLPVLVLGVIDGQYGPTEAAPPHERVQVRPAPPGARGQRVEATFVEERPRRR